LSFFLARKGIWIENTIWFHWLMGAALISCGGWFFLMGCEVLPALPAQSRHHPLSSSRSVHDRSKHRPRLFPCSILIAATATGGSVSAPRLPSLREPDRGHIETRRGRIETPARRTRQERASERWPAVLTLPRVAGASIAVSETDFDYIFRTQGHRGKPRRERPPPRGPAAPQRPGRAWHTASLQPAGCVLCCVRDSQVRVR